MTEDYPNNVDGHFDLDRLSGAVASISALASEWPLESAIYLTEVKEFKIDQLPSGVNERQLATALAILPLFSATSTHLLTMCWTAYELGRSCLNSLGQKDILVSSNLARSLMETAAAFAVESSEFRGSWQTFMRERDINESDSIAKFVRPLASVWVQSLFATRDPRMLEYRKETGTNVETVRTNILNHIDKVSKWDDYDPNRIREGYDSLCDVVHPSLGATAVFVSGGDDDEADQIHRVKFSQRDNWGEGGYNANWGACWSLELLDKEFRIQKDLLEGISKTFKLWCLGLDCFGIVRPRWFHSDPVFDFDSD